MAVASPDFVRDRLGNGLGPHNVLTAPFLVFNRKDDLQAEWVSQAFGLASPRLLERHVPSSEAYANAAAMGWGIGILPELQARERLRAGALLDLRPDRRLEVPLYWHQWKLGRDLAGPSTALLDRVGAALAADAQAAFTR